MVLLGVVSLMWFYWCGFTDVVLLMWVYWCGFIGVGLLVWFYWCGFSGVVLLVWFYWCGFIGVGLLVWFYWCGFIDVVLLVCSDPAVTQEYCAGKCSNCVNQRSVSISQNKGNKNSGTAGDFHPGLSWG